MEPAFLKEISNSNQVVYLFAEDELIRSDFLDRDHLRGMEDLFPTLPDPKRAREETLNNVVKASNHYLYQAKQHELMWLTRSPESNKDQVLSAIESILVFHKLLERLLN